MAEDLKPLFERLDMIINLCAFALIDGKKQREQIRLLAQAGFGPTRIAEMLGTTSNTVSVELSSLRKARQLKTKTK